MSLSFRVIQPSEISELIDFEQRKLQEQITDEAERAIHSWNARWRQEALEHYVPIGWSFLVRDSAQASEFSPEGALLGYFIAQPIMFLDGNTQSLWVEHLQFSSLKVRDELSDFAYRLCREKHLQKVYFPKNPATMNSTRHMRAEDWLPQTLAVKTTKV